MAEEKLKFSRLKALAIAAVISFAIQIIHLVGSHLLKTDLNVALLCITIIVLLFKAYPETLIWIKLILGIFLTVVVVLVGMAISENILKFGGIQVDSFIGFLIYTVPIYILLRKIKAE